MSSENWNVTAVVEIADIWHAMIGSEALLDLRLPTTEGVEPNSVPKVIVLLVSVAERAVLETCTSLVVILAARLETSLSSSVSIADKLETSLSRAAVLATSFA